ncbi:MAG: hypothetical protein KDA32_11215 [Phycisphaerales bacterium]|nr:hypothetical protein [Phycisphaerales bacterium]
MSRRTLIMPHCVEDIGDTLAAAPSAHDRVVLTADPDTSARLTALDIPHLTPFELVNRDERAAYLEYEAGALRFFDAQARVDTGYLNPLAVARYRLTGAHRRLTWMSYLTRRAMQRLRPGRAISFAGECGHGLDQPADVRRLALFEGVLRASADALGVQNVVVRRSSAAGRFVDHVAARNRETALRRPDVAGDLRGRPYVLFQSNGVDLIRQAPLVRATRDALGLPCVQIFSHATAEQLEHVRSLGHIVWNERALCATSDRMPDEAGRSGLRRFLEAARVEPAASELFTSSHTRSHIDFLFGPYSETVGRALLGWRRFFSEWPPIAVIANYHAPAVDAAVAAGIPTLTLTHGLMMIGQTAWYETLPECDIAALSDRHARTLIETGIDERRIKLIGDPYADAMVRDGSVPDEDPEKHAMRAAARAKLGVEPDKRLVAICTGSLGMPAKTSHAPIADFAAAFRGLGALADLIGRRHEWRFAIKRHPRFDHHEAHDRAFARLPERLRPINADQVSLADLSLAADAIVVWNVLTSGLVESSFWGRPTYLLDEGLIWHDHALWATDAWPCVSSHRSLEDELTRVFADDAHAAKRGKQARAAANNFTPGAGVSSLDRGLAWVEGAARARRGQSAAIPQSV